MRVICDEILCCSVIFSVMIPDFIIDKGGSRFVTVIYDETKIFIIKSDFYDGFGFVIKIFVIEVDIPSSVMTKAMIR